MKLRFEVRSAYGKTRYYPENDEADIICAVAERKCLSAAQITLLESGGFTVELSGIRSDRELLEEQQRALDAQSVEMLNKEHK